MYVCMYVCMCVCVCVFMCMYGSPGEPYNGPNIVINDTRMDVLTLLYILGALCLEADLWMLKYTCVFKKHLLALESWKRE